jgi:hypothetical protein
MRKTLRYFLRTFLVLLLMLGLLIIFMLNPQIVYAKKHSYKQLNVYSKYKYPPGYDKVLDQTLQLVKQSEIYHPQMKLDIFLNDGNGASVKFVLKKAFGNAFAWGYHNNVVLNGATDDSLKWVSINGYHRQLARTIAHEMIHCYEVNKLGMFHSRPFANIPVWKWEGYPEYISYKSSINDEKKVLTDAIQKYNLNKDNKDFRWAMVNTDEGESFAGKDYYRFWILVKYLCDIRKFSFDDLIKTSLTEEKIYDEMILWYNNQAKAVSPPAGP